MAKFHINSSGEAGECHAQAGGCPFGDADAHFTSKEGARAAFEAKHNTFTKTQLPDLSDLAPEWHDKLPASVEAKIAKELQKNQDFLDDVDAGRVELRFANVQEFLSPPIYALRDRGSYFSESSGIPEGEFVIGIHSRQGGGNRECWCEDNDNHDPDCLALNNEEMESHPQYAWDEDDDYDKTYATHYFRGGFTQDDVDKHDTQRVANQKAHRLRDLKKMISEGTVPPWAALSENNTKISEYERQKTVAARARTLVQDTKKEIELTNIGISSIESGTEIDPAVLEEISRKISNYNGQYKRLNAEIVDQNRKKAETASAQARFDQAQALPDSELKKYLVGDRGIGSYETTEKVGRRNVKMKKEYQKGSLLGKELESAKTSEANGYRYNFKLPLEKLNEAKKKATDSLVDLQKTEETLEDARVDAWRAGWPGLIRDLPPIPETF